MPVLSAADIDFWEENGYVVVHDAVPPENYKAAERAIWDFLEMDTDDPETWYPDPPRRGYYGRDLSASGVVGQSAIPPYPPSLF